MASDDLEARKRVLEDLIDSLGSWMIGFIWPVAIGLFIEFYAVLQLPATLDWNTFIDRIGLLLVTAGVAGELLIETKTHTAERRLRAIDTQIERELNAELKAADERIAALNLKVEQEQFARVKLEKEIAWRRLSAEQKTLVHERLRSRSGQRVYIVPGVQGEEARTFARSLNTALAGANWITSTEVVKPRRIIEATGLCVLAAGDDRTRNAANDLFLTLEELGFTSHLMLDHAIFTYPMYWPQDLVSQASASPQTTDMVLIVILDKPEPAV